jgi:hypothetical protein
MLNSQGYTVIHSTRHCAIEYGKDVLAIADDGMPCAFQLKGNPGSSITLSQYRQIRPQLDELVNQRIEHPSVTRDVQHRSYLVTNGRIEEEVLLAINQVNDANARDGFPKRKLETIGREQLLSWATDLEASLWPSELEEVRTLLEIITHEGNELFPVEKFHRLLTTLFELIPQCERRFGSDELARRLASAALLTAVALMPFSKRENYWAVITAWVMFSVYAIGFGQKQEKNHDLIRPSLKVASEVIEDNLTCLINETCARQGRYWEGFSIADFPVYEWRLTLLMGIGSLYWLECERTDHWREIEMKEQIESMLPSTQNEMKLWGEGAVPHFLLHEWYLEKRGIMVENAPVMDLANSIFSKNLFCVYYSAEDVIRHELSLTLEGFTSPIAEDAENDVIASYFAEAIMVHMAQRNLKEACQQLWKSYSRVKCLEFHPSKSWMYCLWHCDEGDNHMFNPPEKGEWGNLVSASQRSLQDTVPSLLVGSPLLLGLWCLIAPHRGTTTVICRLYESFSGDARRLSAS